MYVPSHFEEKRSRELQRLMRDHPLATLVTSGPDGLDANHIPFEFDPGGGAHGVLRAHVARANPICAAGYDETEALVIFRGDAAYISPNWYPSKHEFHNMVPTWNYQVVHAHGLLRIRDDEPYVRALVARLTRAHEAGQPVPLIAYQAPSFSRTAAITALESVGRTWRITCNVREINGVLAATRAGIGIAAFPHSLIPPDLQQLPASLELPELGDIDFRLLDNPISAREPIDALAAAIVARQSQVAPTV